MSIKARLKKLIGPRSMRTYHAIRSNVRAALAGFPAGDMVVIGVTGTNGKTTTAHLITSIFETAGYSVALFSTIEMRIKGVGRANETKMTVPTPKHFNRFLQQAKAAKCTILVMEATSIALDQYRTAGLHFDTGVLTNITHDHLDYHGNFTAYVQAKRKLFARGLRLSVINADDHSGSMFTDLPAMVHLDYSVDKKSAAVHPFKLELGDTGINIDLIRPDSSHHLAVSSSLVGMFNVSNILAAVAVGCGWGLPDQDICTGVANVRAVPGRMEEVSVGQPFKVIIDYAHTPDALEKLYAALQPLKKGRIIAVLGATGDRDKTKRPVLGRIVGKEADYCFITNEDPWTEEHQAIIDAVAAGVPDGNPGKIEGKTFWRIADRGEAIQRAIAMAKTGDIVTITGKGAETGMGIGNHIVPWSDRDEAMKALKNLHKNV